MHLFDAFGVEMEYMLVDKDTLDVRPVADSLLAMLAGGTLTGDVELGPATWSNELALHVIELKTTAPAPALAPLPAQFQQAIQALQPPLDRLHARLLPTAMHPWMNPARETMLWPHECHEIYNAYHQIFNCKRHGWANVQSVHLNLPFWGDEEFARLHAAVRIVLPILPALAASSPIVEGNATGRADSRMQFYAEHCDLAPTLTGKLIPEPVFDEATYRREIFEPIRREIQPLDSGKVLELDFLNARGAIARFDRGSIELRVMDVQEYPGADVAICAAVTAVIKALTQETPSPLAIQQALPADELREILERVAVDAEQTVLEHAGYLQALGLTSSRITAGEVWQELLERCLDPGARSSPWLAPLETIQSRGTLATRIRAALGDSFEHEQLVDVYQQVADCLVRWEPFCP